MDLSVSRLKSIWATKISQQSPSDPQNSYFNILLDMDKKGVSNIYRVMLGKKDNILDEISNKWKEKAGLDLTTFLLSKSFGFLFKIDDKCHHTLC